jgi:hypothetical protein
MQLQAHYDPVQDRVLLRRRGASPDDEAALWITRRQLTSIAVACARASTSVSTSSGEGDQRPKVASGTARRERSSPPEGQVEDANANAKLVTGIKFRRGPAGLRIELAVDDAAPLAIALKGGDLAAFAELLARVAARAKWDLEAALARVGSAAAPNRTLH